MDGVTKERKDDIPYIGKDLKNNYASTANH